MEAGVFEEHFDDTIAYDDNMIIEIMDAASDLLDIDIVELQKDFGETYFEYCLSSNHGKMLRKLGGNLYDFLANIDSLHDHLAVSFAGVKIPSFRVKQECGGRISLNYYSDREELESVTPGIIKRAAKVLFGIDVEATKVPSDCKTILITTTYPEDADRMFPKQIESLRDIIPRANEPKVSPLEFTKVFPFHIVFDRDMRLIQIGAALRRILRDINCSKEAYVTSYFTLSRPQIDLDFESVHSRLNNLFVLTTVQSMAGPLNLHGENFHGNHQSSVLRHNFFGRRANLRLKGQMVYIEDKDLMIFLCSPSVSNIQDMRNKGLCLSDIPIHDATRDLVLLSEKLQKELELTQQLGIVSDHLQKIHSELEEHLILYNRLLFAVLPTTIAKRLGEGKSVATERFLSVTLMFSGIVDFQKLCNAEDSRTIVRMLNDLYTRFDSLVGFLADYAYKVETVGDKYMSASGVPERVSNHSNIICNLALDMHDAAKNVVINGKEISVTFGIHSGEVVAGVIGQKMPRYCLFGNTVNLTSRTETTGIPGEINVTEDTYKLLDQSNEQLTTFNFDARGQTKMKGKSEPITTYTLKRANSRNIAIPLFSNKDNDIITSPQSAYFSLYKKRKGTVIIVNKSRSMSRFTTPGGSRSTSIAGTPTLRSRCGSGISTSQFIGLPLDFNNNIYEGVELPSTSLTTTKTTEATTKQPSMPNISRTDRNNKEEIEGNVLEYADSLFAPSVMSDIQIEDVTKTLNEINKSIQNER